mgnify:CR=1 FL=1
MEKRSENMTKLIELKGINKTYKNGGPGTSCLKKTSNLEVEEGENFVANLWVHLAQGKSTLMNVIWLVGPPDQRRVFPRRSGGWKSQ